MEKSPARQMVDSKLTKVQNLQTTLPETFGNTSVHQTKFSTGYDPLEASINKKNALIEKLAIQAWSRVSGSGAKRPPSKKWSIMHDVSIYTIDISTT